jgi:hypothetical protein
MVNRKEKLAIISLCLSLIVVGIAVWRLTNVEVVPFKYSVENVRFNEEWFNFTVFFTELPKGGLTINGIKMCGVTQNFAPRQLASGDRITFKFPLAEPILELPKNLKATLYTEEMGIVTIQITD